VNPISLAIIISVVMINVVVIGVYVLLDRRRTVVEQRLGQITQSSPILALPADAPAQRSSRFGQSVNQALVGRGFGENIQRSLSRADLKINVAEYLAIHILLALGLFVVGWILGGLVMAVIFGVAALFMPRMYVKYLQGKRLRTFDGQLGDMLNLMVNGLRAGYSSMQAQESVSRELPAPISVEFHRVVQEIQLGLPQEAALANLLRRVPSADLDFVVTAINVQREVGGNLAEILDNISYTIRERVRIKGEIQTLTAQGQITAWVITLLPIGLALFLFIVNRAYMLTFFGPPIILGIPLCGVAMLATALIMIVTGFFIVQKIVDIEV
jgi:tight adherence protein B